MFCIVLLGYVSYIYSGSAPVADHIDGWTDLFFIYGVCRLCYV